MEIVKQSISPLLLIAYFTKTAMVGANLADAAILFVLAGLYAYDQYRPSNKQLDAINIKIKEHDQNIDGLKSSVAAVKMGTGMRSLNGR